ncbi:MAG: AAA family ATPase [Chitinophagaceae bacterium]
MKDNHIEFFEVFNFKKFDHLQVENLGKFNLIVGDNNVGKTTLLESLVLGDDVRETMSRLLACLTWRKITYNNNSANYLETYFKNSKNQSIKYTLGNIASMRKFSFSTVTTASLSKEQQNDLNLRNIGNQPYPFSAILEEEDTTSKAIDFLNPDASSNSYLPFIHYTITFGSDLIEFYSDIIKENKNSKLEILSKLRIIIPEIENIEINSGTMLSTTFLITLKDQDKPILLNQFGDGTVKLFRYILEIMKCSGGRVMIDEIDSGLHYSKMKNFLKLIIELSIEKNVQIFATTHSKDCVEYFTKSLEELRLEQDARIIRLADTKDGIKSYTMKYDEFKNAIQSESEIR